jgi:NADH-quinone oxidoreductase subunit J
MDVILFLIFAVIAVVCAINVVVQTHPISSALSLVGVMGSLAILYLLLGAEFLAAAQVIVYAGAIMVLFVFVIMLVNAGAETRTGRSFMVQLLGAPLLIALLGLLAYFVQRMLPAGATVAATVHFGGFTGGSARDIGHALFTTYLLTFEVTSVLILIAIVGAIVLARKELE